MITAIAAGIIFIVLSLTIEHFELITHPAYWALYGAVYVTLVNWWSFKR